MSKITIHPKWYPITNNFLDFCRSMHKGNKHTNFALQVGNVEPQAALVRYFGKTTKYWFKGSGIYAIQPPIDGYLSCGMLVDWYFVMIGITPRALDHGKPEVSVFRCSPSGDVSDMESDEIRECRTVLAKIPKEEDEYFAIHERLLNKLLGR